MVVAMCVLVGVILILCQVGYTVYRKITFRQRHEEGEQAEELLHSVQMTVINQTIIIMIP